jgi:hypothetical protein
MAITFRKTDADYEQNWRDLRRRELAFWTVVLSYLPAMGLTILVASLLHHDVPKDFAIWIGGGWIAVYIGASLYRRRFRCPRCHNFFFRRGGDQSSSPPTCAHCALPCWTPKDPDPEDDILSQQ